MTYQIRNVGLVAHVQQRFADREIIMRSGGKVQCLRVSGRLQMGALAVAVALVAGLAALFTAAVLTQYRAADEREIIAAREAAVAAREGRLATYRTDIEAAADDLERRQTFIEDMVDSLPADMVTPQGEPDAAKVGAAPPEARRLDAVKARQLAFVEYLIRETDARARRAEAALAGLGLDAGTLVTRADRQAMGGPLERLATESDGSVDPRFARLGQAIARMAALERGLARVPQVAPARTDMISSGFGYRSDPITGAAAMHKGLDFRGALGTPIRAAADGRVRFVGTNGGYGQTVEIDHGNGLMTRYAHMSRYAARAGQMVKAGDMIGAIGNTGRSTGPHLHFEVRLNDRAMNPRTFLEKAPHVLQGIRRGGEPAR